jgi:hypothetical protein
MVYQDKWAQGFDGLKQYVGRMAMNMQDLT